MLGPLMHGGGQWLTLIALYSGNRAVVYTERHFDAARVLDLAVSEHATTIGIIGDAMARPGSGDVGVCGCAAVGAAV